MQAQRHGGTKAKRKVGTQKLLRGAAETSFPPKRVHPSSTPPSEWAFDWTPGEAEVGVCA
jgi:hypothetical protein